MKCYVMPEAAYEAVAAISKTFCYIKCSEIFYNFLGNQILLLKKQTFFKQPSGRKRNYCVSTID